MTLAFRYHPVAKTRAKDDISNYSQPKKTAQIERPRHVSASIAEKGSITIGIIEIILITTQYKV